MSIDQNEPFIKILEQPARSGWRWRHRQEGRNFGPILGANWSPESPSYPTIQIESCQGPAVVVISCVTKDSPYRPHPHSIVDKPGSTRGVHAVVIDNPEMVHSFTSIAIQSVQSHQVQSHLDYRKSLRVDPFKTGFDHKDQPEAIDLNVVRLAFQAFIEGSQKGKFIIPLKPIVSEPIYNSVPS